MLLEAYIPTEAIGEDNDTIDNGTDISVNLSVQHENEAPAAYPMVQPIKAALYFETADGFGEWRILISTRADRNLREFRNKNPTLFRIVIKKIK